MALPMKTATQVTADLAERTGITQTDIRHMLDELHALVLSELKSGNRFKLVGLVQLEPKVRPARAARMGRNPATGESVKIAAKPAETVIRARLLAEVRNVPLGVKKLSERIEEYKPAPRERPWLAQKAQVKKSKPVKKVKARAKAKNKR